MRRIQTRTPRAEREKQQQCFHALRMSQTSVFAELLRESSSNEMPSTQNPPRRIREPYALPSSVVHEKSCL